MGVRRKKKQQPQPLPAPRPDVLVPDPSAPPRSSELVSRQEFERKLQVLEQAVGARIESAERNALLPATAAADGEVEARLTAMTNSAVEATRRELLGAMESFRRSVAREITQLREDTGAGDANHISAQQTQ